MDDFGQDHEGEGLLDAFLHPIRRVRRLRFARSRGRVEVLEADQTRTVIEGESVNTDILQPEHYLSCGHNPRGNPTAQCVCGNTVCEKCLGRCLCGNGLCPNCGTTDPSTGITMCHYCSDDQTYRRRAAAVGRFFLNLLGDVDSRQDRRP